MNDLALEPVGTVVSRPVIDEEVAAVEVLVVGEDEPLVGGASLVLPKCRCTHSILCCHADGLPHGAVERM